MTNVLIAEAETAGPEIQALGEGLRISSRADMATALARALEQGGVRAVYQPKINLNDLALTGVEALARWDSAEFGIVSPDVFIPLAEQFGLIETLTAQILDHALNTCARLRQHVPTLTVAVNISPLLLHGERLVRLIDGALEKSGMPPECLVAEITESHAIQNEAAARATLGALRLRGIGCAIDDFGTGHASLLSLLRMPFNELKIDRAFISRMHTDEAGAIIRATLNLAREMRLHVVAEGIETEGAERMLRDLGCDTGQGYRYGQPQRIETLLASLGAQLH